MEVTMYLLIYSLLASTIPPPDYCLNVQRYNQSHTKEQCAHQKKGKRIVNRGLVV